MRRWTDSVWGYSTMANRSVRLIVAASALALTIVAGITVSGAALAGEREQHESRPSGARPERDESLPDSGLGNAFALTGDPGVGSVALTWDDPDATTSSQRYLVRVSDAGIAPIATTSPSATISGLTPGLAYTFSVERQDGTHATSQVVVVPNSPAVLTQVNSVTRPEGILLMRVSCGVYGALPAFGGASADWPGFPRSLGAVEADNNANAATTDAGCGSLFHSLAPVATSTEESANGWFVSAWSRLSQITVIDTRNDDTGWALTGSVTAVFASDGRRWDGNYLGWAPVITNDSARVPTGPKTFYDQTVTAGAVVLPGSGLVSGDGLASGPANLLASARPGAGLGEAVIDGRLLLMLPAAATAPSYSMVITLSLI